ncbi:hypothetical protein [Lichenifustis flavocetrariae]|uniref:Uncharacterized protein n=1 Tax=Lichenifustis flavocetrariae TaxID=2949735 RepID=A0AA42CI39_9HYPH|nr:hypothetical protein [Lichenifustis flavocetrariae]MCW6508193.1 hypothetical protein [Lichenifustis flavocetrariae]
MSRVFWRAYAALSIVIIIAMLAIPAGPALENRYAPVRGSVQTVEVIERSAGRLCWAWTFTKLRAIGSDNLDAFLVINGEPGGVAAPFDMDSGRPWGMTRYAVAARAEPYRLRMCAPLPPYVRLSDTVTVQQTAFYPGLWGLWRLHVPFPDVVSVGAKGL